MSSSSSRDSWQRLVEAVMKREQYLELAHKPYSRSPTISTVASDYTDQILDVESISASPSPHPIAQVYKNASSGLIAWKLFSSWYHRREGKDNDFADIPDNMAVLLGRVRRFSLRELKFATQSFSQETFFQRRLNSIHRGWLDDSYPVAVKKFHTTQYCDFEIEVKVYSIVAHPNILHVLGFCITQKRRLLVYPLMANGSVASWLGDRPASQPSLNWRTRKEIAMGTARGLAYLHDECENRIIHRNIRAANVLLNEDFNAVIANFDWARIMDRDSTNVLSDVKGTIGCMAPEYFYRVCSDKTDVYSYGILLLELITGKQHYEHGDEDTKFLDWLLYGDIIDEISNLIYQVKRNCKEKRWKIMADPNSGGEEMEEVVEQLSVIALLCSQDSPDGRPKMSEIVRMLEVGVANGECWEAWRRPV